MSGRSSLTFVLPGDGRSGGVRVTAIMANLLLERGYEVRIVHPRERRSWRSMLRRLFARGEAGFLHVFRGPTETYKQLEDLNFKDGEVVIAVGTYTVADVRALTKPVTKVRFNHGFPAQPNSEEESAWRGPMTTITVSATLLPKLQNQTNGSVWGVVPNGVNTQEYFAEPDVLRNGIGALFSRHPNKAPEDLVAVLRAAHERWPHIPQHVFGTESRPAGLEHANYTRLPSVDAARRIYNRCRAWVITSRTEGLPGVVLEAMACGCVVISSDNDGSLEILADGENGLIAPSGDRAAFLRHLEAVLFDDERAAELRRASAATVARFTWEAAADRMETFLNELPAGQTARELTNHS